MTLRWKAPLAIAALFLAVTPSAAADFTYSEYSKASEDWRQGFVLGISQYLSTVAQPDEEAPYPLRSAYERCLARSTDVALVRHVEAYAAKNPASIKDPMVRVVIRALFELCRSEINKARPFNAAPSRK